MEPEPRHARLQVVVFSMQIVLVLAHVSYLRKYMYHCYALHDSWNDNETGQQLDGYTTQTMVILDQKSESNFIH